MYIPNCSKFHSSVELSYNSLKNSRLHCDHIVFHISIITGNIIALEKFMVANQLTKKSQNFSTSGILQYAVFSNVYLDLVLKTVWEPTIVIIIVASYL